MADAAPRRSQQRRPDRTILMAEPAFDEVGRRVWHGCQTSAAMLCWATGYVMFSRTTVSPELAFSASSLWLSESEPEKKGCDSPSTRAENVVEGAQSSETVAQKWPYKTVRQIAQRSRYSPSGVKTVSGTTVPHCGQLRPLTVLWAPRRNMRVARTPTNPNMTADETIAAATERFTEGAQREAWPTPPLDGANSAGLTGRF